MRNPLPARLLTIVCSMLFAAATATARQAASGDEFAGQWTGTWDGAGSGSIELLLQRRSDGKPAGKVAVTTDNGNYEAELKIVEFKGKSIEAAYDFPLDPSAEVVMSATVDGGSAKGTWLLRPKSGGAEVASGTFAMTKK